MGSKNPLLLKLVTCNNLCLLPQIICFTVVVIHISASVQMANKKQLKHEITFDLLDGASMLAS